MLNPISVKKFKMAVTIANFLPYIVRAISSYLTLPQLSLACIRSIVMYQETKPPKKISIVPHATPFSMIAYGKVRIPAPRVTWMVENTEALMLPLANFN
jgi:hypothetical protein